MPNQVLRNVLNVFIASPGDLQEERRIAREVVDDLNRIVGRELGWHIELFGWEDTLPGASRPQEIINKDVDVCDLFIGLLWRRWGQPTGIYSSGFEEEFERSKKRRLKLGAPEIWLFFRQVDSAQIEDAGEHLKRVLAFRKTQEESKQLLFKEFSEGQDFRKKIYDSLLTHVLRLNKAHANTPPPSVPQASSLPSMSSAPHETVLLKTESVTDPVRGQLIQLIDLLREAVTRESLDGVPTRTGALEPFHFARLLSLSATWASRLSTAELLSTHAVNLLYQHREKLELIPLEKNLLLRTLIGDVHNVVPGWYWFRNWDAIRTEIVLFELAAEDEAIEVRKRALEILASAGIRPTMEWIDGENVIRLVLSHSEELRKAALAYLGATGVPADIPLVEECLDDADSTIRDQALRTRFLITVRTDPNKALTLLLDSPHSISQDMLSELENNNHGIATEHLLSAIQSPQPEIRSFAVKELLRRDELTIDTIRGLLNDPTHEIREDGFKGLIKLGLDVDPEQIRDAFKSPSEQESPSISPLLLLRGLRRGPDADEIILTLYQSLTVERVLNEIDWFSVNGSIAYKAIGIAHFYSISNRIRSDLEDGFERLRIEPESCVKSDHFMA